MKNNNTNYHNDNDNAVAIIGMGCIFPKANGLKQYWRLIFNGEDAISDVPEDTHWSLKDYFSKDPSTPDHTYCSRGGFIPAVSFDPAKYGMPPNNLDATDTSQLLGLVTAEMALIDAGYGDESSLIRQRTNIILGVTGTQELVIPLGARLGHPIWKKALKDSNISPEKADEIVKKISNSYTQWQENSFPGLLGNVVPGRIANRLNLWGTNSAVDAACASSLGAINTAVMELVSGRCDMSITGGVDTLNDIFMHMCFSKTGVLSHTGDARPFSENADGTVLGEGLGMIVLKRLKDAEKDKDRIYAVIKGIGTSSDGKSGGIYAPNAKGQLRALKSAYNRAGIDPSTVELIEAHGTGTRVGDKIEFTALKELMKNCPKRNSCAIGSVKSMIGHTKAAAGAAGIIKSALCLYNKVIPPTLKAERPDPDLDIKNTPFYINQKSKAWLLRYKHPRRSGVSAFGFGGSNFHIVLEEYNPVKKHVSWDGKIHIVPFSSNTKKELVQKILEFKKIMEQGRTWDTREKEQLLAWQSGLCCKNFSISHEFRLIFIINENENYEKIAERACKFLESDSSTKDNELKYNINSNNSEIFFGKGKQKGKLGFLFPGQGSQYPGMGRELVGIFPEAMDVFSLAESEFEKLYFEKNRAIADYIFPPSMQDKKTVEKLLRATDIAQPAIGAVSLAMVKILKRFGIKPDMACGHSFGELTALCSAGWLDDETFMKLAVARGRYMAQACDNSKEKGGMLAIKAPLKDIETFVIKDLDLILANRNTHDQGVISGKSKEIKKAVLICRKKNFPSVKLPVSAAFHTHFVEPAAIPFKNLLKNLSIKCSEIPVFSNTTGDQYPLKEYKAKKLLGNQIANPVNFIKNIENMFKNNVRTFLEIGPKSVLTNLVTSILKDKKITAVSFDNSSGKKSAIRDLACLLCNLAASGIKVDLRKWEEPCHKPLKKIMRIPLTGANIKSNNNSNLPLNNKIYDKTHKINDKMQKPVLIKENKKKPLNNRHKKGDGMSSINTSQNAHTYNTENNIDNHDPDFKENTGQNLLNKDTDFPENNEVSNIIIPQKATSLSMTYNAMVMLQKGLDSMEALQTQTARTHEKFLETQQMAGKTLRLMMEQTRIFAQAAITGNSVSDNEISPLPRHKRSVHNNASASDNTEKKYNSNAETSPYDGYINNDAGSEIHAPVHNHLPCDTYETQYPPDDINGAQLPLINSEIINNNDNSVINKPDCGENAQNTNVMEADAMEADNSEKSAGNDLNRKTIKKLLLETISRLTGFPGDMLELDMNIESDLGIDSIKRVEIISELEKTIPNAKVLSPENMGSLKTLGDIYTALEDETDFDTVDNFKTDLNSNYKKNLHDNEKTIPDEKKTLSDAIMAIIIETISSLTGFPCEMLKPEMNLESDLGIDSIKRVEILSQLEQKLPEYNTISPDDMAQIKTIEQIANHITNHDTDHKYQCGINNQNKNHQTDFIKDIPSDPGTEDISKNFEKNIEDMETNKKKTLLRQIIRLKEFPIDHIKFHNGSRICLPENKKIYITQDCSGIAQRFQKEFEHMGIPSEIILMNMDHENNNNHDINKISSEQKNDHQFNDNLAPDDAAGLIIISDSLACKDRGKAEKFLKSAFNMTKKFAGKLICSGAENGSIFTTISFLGGKFGFDNSLINEPVQGGLAGLAKTADLEFKNVLCRNFDMPDNIDECMKNIKTAASLAMIHGPVEMGIKNNTCHIPQLYECPVIKGDTSIDNDDVIVITGGAKGVTAHCALALAKKYSPTIILIGRSKKPKEEPLWVRNLSKEKDIKQAIILNKFHNAKPVPAEIQKIYKEIISNREIKATIQKIKSAGSNVDYFSLDIRDSEKIHGVMDEIKKKYGRITGVIHGAGVVEDKLIVDKKETQFAKVFDTKVKGMNNLLDATKDDNLKYFILFSSIAARTGNMGQVDYAMANEVLNKTAQQKSKLKSEFQNEIIYKNSLKNHKNCKFISINWGPWDGGMVNPSLKREFEKNGIDLIPFEKGAEAMINEMEAGDQAEVVIGAQLVKENITGPDLLRNITLNIHDNIHQDITDVNINGMHNTMKRKKITSNEAINSSMTRALEFQVGIKSCPVLYAHKIAGQPVVPFALMMEWFAHGGELSNPGLYFMGMDNIRMLKGIKPESEKILSKNNNSKTNIPEEINISIKTGRCKPVENGFKVDAIIISSDKEKNNSLHSQSVILLGPKLLPPPVHAKSDILNLKACNFSINEAYKSILFHGRQLQGIKSITGISQNSIEIVSLRTPEPEKWFKNPFADDKSLMTQSHFIKKWIIDPLVIDSAFQAAIIWCYQATGNVCLPSYIANFRIYSSFTQCKGNVKIIFTANKKTDHSIQGYFTFLNENNIIIASITGFEAVVDNSLIKKFKPWKPLTTNLKSKTSFKSTPKLIKKDISSSAAEVRSADTDADTNQNSNSNKILACDSKKSKPKTSEPRDILFSKKQILSFAIGKPSDAFGDKYRDFDDKRKIARLPGPPYCFMDRVIKADHNPWEMKPGGWIEAEFDLPSNGWYFKADRSDTLPFCILLEIALQPCGWLAAYAGSALKNSKRMFFRNLGGEGEIIKPVYKDMGCLTMRARMTNVSEAGGMIIQDFDMEVLKDKDLFYKGHTNFGFFTKQSLNNQMGIRKIIFDYTPSNKELAMAESFILDKLLPTTPLNNDKFSIINTKTRKKPDPCNDASSSQFIIYNSPLYPDDPNCGEDNGMPSKALRMIDKIDLFIPEGGQYKKGYIKASKKIDPNEWFFKAHFFQDPVCPGSLGIESFLQLMRFFALKKFNYSPDEFKTPMTHHTHKWIYRGQITPSNSNIEIHAHIKEINENEQEFPVITADGILCVDSLCIYQMENFSIAIKPKHILKHEPITLYSLKSL